MKTRAFLRGLGTILDIAGTTSVRRTFLERSDAEALASDWRAVGGDLRKVLPDDSSRRPSRREGEAR